MEKKYIQFLIVFLLGSGIGALVIYLATGSVNQEEETQKLVKTVYKPKVVRDTVYLSKKEKSSSQDEDETYPEVLEERDTLDTVIDSLVLWEDTNNVSDDLIVSEQMSSSVKVKLRKFQESDSVDVEDIFNVKSEHYASEMTVQFWTSPLQLTGYELSRNTLKLFGFDPRQAVLLQAKEGNRLQLVIDTMSFELRKTDKFISLEL
ncbi:hypothetical protein SAMN05216474_0020 [Lishizhenia tianjinensis]|uniref:Uncharacterized protein n=1 Tax=Lishizhenia tianjinensis TaxID=477690 RepID=A0A1I6X9C3_9FLAO|nr:hypothetical protein [Lishizhenia tianjinensis]SFT34756.1 hypothetical protein SAMN05216474_0020 [Lishizhenia tianjinensis]